SRAARGAFLSRSPKNPILEPSPDVFWENAAVFNPAAFYDGERVHLLYRALGQDGISRIGYAVSDDGIHFQRFPNPAFVMRTPSSPKFRNPFAEGGRYDKDAYASGGGWGGSEDPRAVLMEGRLYMNFGVFENWDSIRVALTSIGLADFKARVWNWAPHFFLSPPNETHKNWVLFPEKIRGKFAILHALTPHVMIDYADSLETWAESSVQSNNERGGRRGHWDEFVRGAAAPPLRTKYGWLLLYHAMNPKENHGYKVGAMLLDINDPTKILHRSDTPILQPLEWYEHDWKPGVVYASGSIIKDGTLFVYYGGGDKRVNVATAPLETFLHALMQNHEARLA
ncbi:MAG: hypothetical protein Q8Q13_00945, partial [bacterium]|nr:hypothetical protein [bacterium]